MVNVAKPSQFKPDRFEMLQDPATRLYVPVLTRELFDEFALNHPDCKSTRLSQQFSNAIDKLRKRDAPDGYNWKKLVGFLLIDENDVIRGTRADRAAELHQKIDPRTKGDKIVLATVGIGITALYGEFYKDALAPGD